MALDPEPDTVLDAMSPLTLPEEETAMPLFAEFFTVLLVMSEHWEELEILMPASPESEMVLFLMEGAEALPDKRIPVDDVLDILLDSKALTLDPSLTLMPIPET